MHGGGGGMCGRGHVWQGACMAGACMVGGVHDKGAMHGRGHVWHACPPILWCTVNEQPVRILLECILSNWFQVIHTIKQNWKISRSLWLSSRHVWLLSGRSPVLVQHPTSAETCRESYAGHIHWQRCYIRGESWGTYIMYASTKCE